VQTNLSVQTVQTNCGGEVGGRICKSVITPAPNYTFANSSFHLSPTVGLHGLHEEIGLHLIHCPCFPFQKLALCARQGEGIGVPSRTNRSGACGTSSWGLFFFRLNKKINIVKGGVNAVGPFAFCFCRQAGRGYPLQPPPSSIFAFKPRSSLLSLNPYDELTTGRNGHARVTCPGIGTQFCYPSCPVGSV